MFSVHFEKGLVLQRHPAIETVSKQQTFVFDSVVLSAGFCVELSNPGQHRKLMVNDDDNVYIFVHKRIHVCTYTHTHAFKYAMVLV